MKVRLAKLLRNLTSYVSGPVEVGRVTNRHTIVGTWPLVPQVSTSSDPRTSGNRTEQADPFRCRGFPMWKVLARNWKLGSAGVVVPACLVVEIAIGCVSAVVEQRSPWWGKI